MLPPLRHVLQVPRARSSDLRPRRCARTATERANRIWKRALAAFEAPPLPPERAEALADFVARRRAEGGAPPMS